MSRTSAEIIQIIRDNKPAIFILLSLPNNNKKIILNIFLISKFVTTYFFIILTNCEFDNSKYCL